MKLNTVFLLNVIVGLALGAAYFLVPDQVAASQGISLNASGIFVARVAGALLIGYGFVSWFVRNLSEADAIRAVVPGYFGGYVFSFIAALWGQLSGVANVLGWSNVVITFLFALAYGYFLFIRKR